MRPNTNQGQTSWIVSLLFLIVAVAPSYSNSLNAQQEVLACFNSGQEIFLKMQGKTEMLEHMKRQQVTIENVEELESEMNEERIAATTDVLRCVSENIFALFSRFSRSLDAENAKICIDAIHTSVLDYFIWHERYKCSKGPGSHNSEKDARDALEKLKSVTNSFNKCTG